MVCEPVVGLIVWIMVLTFSFLGDIETSREFLALFSGDKVIDLTYFFIVIAGRGVIPVCIMNILLSFTIRLWRETPMMVGLISALLIAGCTIWFVIWGGMEEMYQANWNTFGISTLVYGLGYLGIVFLIQRRQPAPNSF